MGLTDAAQSFQKKVVVESSTALEYVAHRCCGISSLEVLKAQLDKDTDIILAAISLWAGGSTRDLQRSLSPIISKILRKTPQAFP